MDESPVRRGVLWAGTTNGRLWRTSDGGSHWVDLTDRLPVAARGVWVNRVEAGNKDDATAYVALSGYRVGNYAPLIFRTTDNGATWQDLAANLPAKEPVHVLREDPLNPDVLYVGTELGLYVSLDAGKSWQPFGNLPSVAIEEILVEPRSHDIIVATKGLSLFVIDNVRAIPQLTQEIRGREAYLFPPDTLVLGTYFNTETAASRGDFYRAPNPPRGVAVLTYYVNPTWGGRRDADSTVKISVATESGRPWANFELPARPGINRGTWDLAMTSDLIPAIQGAAGRPPALSEGTVIVTIRYKGAENTQRLVLRSTK